MTRLNRRTFVASSAASAVTGATMLAWGSHPVMADIGLQTVRLTSVKTGSVAWLIDTIVTEKLDAKHGLKLKVREIANNAAAPITLLSGEADVIVSDWTWAMRQRGRGQDFKFSPYSSALGSLMVRADSPVTTLADLKGKKIGVAGSGVDKSWILLRAYSRKTLGVDIADVARPVFGAAPLIAEELRNGRVDACLNFWTYSARLAGAGARQIVSMADVIEGLGVTPPPALVGFVWSKSAVEKGKVAIDKLFAAVRDANDILAKSDAVWERLRPLVKPKSDKELVAIRDYYRSGITHGWSDADTASAEKLTKLLIELGDTELIGQGTRFDPELFYSPRA